MNAANAVLEKHFRQQPQIPRPTLDVFSMPIIFLPQQLSSICDMSSLAWEACHSGLNGLRYHSAQFEETSIIIQCKEICPATAEDLSSISKFVGKEVLSTISDLERKAYWCARTFSNCRTISHGLLAVLKFAHTRTPHFRLFHGDLEFDPKSVAIQPFSIRIQTESMIVIDGQRPSSQSHHQCMEPIRHVVVTLRTLISHEVYVIDLSGAQFGKFGQDRTRPQFQCLPIEQWRQQFSVCQPTAAHEDTSSIAGKIHLVERVSVSLFELQLQRNMTCSKCHKSALKLDLPLDGCPCREAYYCDTKCQREHWKEQHKKECKAARVKK